MSFFRRYRTGIVLTTVFAYFNLIVPELLSAQESNETGASTPATPEAPREAMTSSAESPSAAAVRDGSGEPAPGVSLPAAPESTSRNPSASTAATSASGASPLGGQAIALPSGAGTVGGAGESFTADQSTGTGTFAIPIALPTARGGTEPALSLTYSSASGSGVAGFGWSIGVPYVARQTDRGVPKYDDRADFHPEQDRLVYNGSDLIPLGAVHGGQAAGASGEAMPNWAEGWQYFRARIEGAYFRFFWSPDHRTWRVQSGHNGMTQELGVALDGQGDTNALETAGEGDTTRIFRWNLARTYDANGQGKPTEDALPQPNNAVVYRYQHDGGSAYLSDIYDTSPAANPVAAPLADYAHHTRLVWQSRPDPAASFRRGWRVDQRLRLASVDVSVKSFTGSGARRQLRRTHLDYDASSHVSLLTAVSLEGRCGGAEDDANVPQEDSNEHLPVTTNCGRMPAVRLSYSHVTATRPVTTAPGYEPFDNTKVALSGSPAFQLDPTLGVAIFDFDGDGFPDILDGDSAANNGAHRVFLNNGQAGFSAPLRVAIPTFTASDGTTGTAYDVSLKNTNLAPLDFDSDGLLNLVLMPRLHRPLVFSSVLDGTGARWQGSAPAWNGQQGLDLVTVRNNTRLADVNGDGLVDFLVNTGSELLTYLSLAAYPGGEGAYGQATRTSATTANVSLTPIHACQPASNGLVLFNDPTVHIADMNGDGLADIARIHRGTAEYWPGRGDGHFGVGDLHACRAPMISAPIAMSNPPFPQTTDSALKLGDVNGDGLTDVIAVAGSETTVWLNIDGASWTAPIVMAQNATQTNVVQIVDVNGSGSADLLFGDAAHYSYLDFLGGQRPWLLTGIESGFGKTTSVEYTTTTAEETRAAAAGTPWSMKVPAVAHLIKRIVTNDHLDAIGRKAGVYTAEYNYADPLFDRNDRAFRGFRTVTRHDVAAPGEVGNSSRVQFHLGECEEEDTPGSCGRFFDNPREGLKGLVKSADTLDDNGNYLSTTHTTYRLRTLYVGLDGRQVRSIHAVAADSFGYETTPFAPQADSISIVDIEREPTPGQVRTESSTLQLQSVAGRVHNRSETTVDPLGLQSETRAYGCIEGCATRDEVITSHTTYTQVPGDASGWMYRPTESYVSGSQNTALRNHTLVTYDAYGRVSQSSSILQGTLPLLRFHETGKPIAPPPTGASADGSIVSFVPGYDQFGHTISVHGADYRCASTSYDAAYAELPVSQGASVGYIYGDGCGATKLASAATFDRGFGLAISITGPNGEKGSADYDEFGRPLRVFMPNPDLLGMTSAQPSKVYEYWLPSDGRPVLGVHTRTLTGSSPDDATYVDSWSFVDSMGRALAAFNPADPTLDGYQWIVKGASDYDSLGRIVKGYLPFYWSGDPLQFAFGSTPTTQYETRTYDGFGRPLLRYATDGTLAGRVDYHALGQDDWDAADLTPGGAHAGTYVSTLQDGHGRIVLTTERMRDATGLHLIDTRATYLPTGEPTSITRAQRDSSDAPVTRWMVYDSLGRLLLNGEPDTMVGFTLTAPADLSSVRAWRYAYDDAGDLVGTSDARGCGVNLFYDAGGRAVAEDRSPCLDAQPAYTAANPSTGEGTETYYRYDQADPDESQGGLDSCGLHVSSVLGKNTSVSSLEVKRLAAFDGRGRLVCGAQRMATPDAASSTTVAGRYAPRWYTKQMSYDGADRLVGETTGGRSPELMGSGGESRLNLTYSTRGMVAGIGGSYGTLVQSQSFDVLGKPTRRIYGDLAATTSSLVYDARHRLWLAQTTRQQPTLWSNPQGSYTPPSSNTSTPTLQTVLEDAELRYDEADNPIQLLDKRDPTQWPDGAKPVNRTVEYDDLYRVKHVQYSYSAGGDAWTSPFAPELAQMATGQTPKSTPSPHVSFDQRIKDESFTYDWKGNLVSGQDDAHGFYDRSLGTQQHGAADAGPYQLRSASNRDVGSTRAGDLITRFDAAGNLAELVIKRDGPCLPQTASCWQRFAYDWDEIGELSRARRWDLTGAERDTLAVADGAPPTRTPDVELHYGYDLGARVRKTAVDTRGVQVHDVYIFASLELRHASFDPIGGDYVLAANTESLRLCIGGGCLGRVVYVEDDVPALQSGRQHVYLELTDHLGSTDIVIDRDTSELVQRTSYTAYGATDSDYRPARWDGYREPYRFSGKEDDIEVGLTYLGARYYAAALGRFISPDPLALHSPGKGDINVYAYVHGRTYVAIDPDGRDFGISLLISAIIAIVVATVVDVAQQEIRISAGRQKSFDFGELALNVGIAAVSSVAGGAVGGAVSGALAHTVSATTATAIGQVAGATVGALVSDGLHQGASYLYGHGQWSWSELGYSGLVGGASSGLGAATSALTSSAVAGSFVSGISGSFGHSLASGTAGSTNPAEHLESGLFSAFASAFGAAIGSQGEPKRANDPAVKFAEANNVEDALRDSVKGPNGKPIELSATGWIGLGGTASPIPGGAVQRDYQLVLDFSDWKVGLATTTCGGGITDAWFVSGAGSVGLSSARTINDMAGISGQFTATLQTPVLRLQLGPSFSTGKDQLGNATYSGSFNFGGGVGGFSPVGLSGMACTTTVQPHLWNVISDAVNGWFTGLDHQIRSLYGSPF
jgi:RHS repeat-associated protein